MAFVSNSLLITQQTRKLPLHSRTRGVWSSACTGSNTFPNCSEVTFPSLVIPLPSEKGSDRDKTKQGSDFELLMWSMHDLMCSDAARLRELGEKVNL